jgi:hypothetical protein
VKKRMKKLLVSLGGALALALVMVTPAEAQLCFGCWNPSKTSADVAIVSNSSSATAISSGQQNTTGGNTAAAGLGAGNAATVNSTDTRNMTVGGSSASSTAVVVANTDVSCCGSSCECAPGHYDVAVVKNRSKAKAVSTGKQNSAGGNTAVAGVGTGNAATVNSTGTKNMTVGGSAARSNAWVVTNTSLSMGLF